MSDTPRTDALSTEKHLNIGTFQDTRIWKLCRHLERELAAAERKLGEISAKCEPIVKMGRMCNGLAGEILAIARGDLPKE